MAYYITLPGSSCRQLQEHVNGEDVFSPDTSHESDYERDILQQQRLNILKRAAEVDRQLRNKTYNTVVSVSNTHLNPIACFELY